MSDIKIYDGEKFSCSAIQEREYQKFGLNEDGEMAVRVLVEPDGGTKNVPLITNYTINDTNEYSHTFQDGVKAFRIKTRTSARMYFAYNVNKTDPNTSTEVWTSGLGGIYEENNLVKVSGLTIYFRLDRSNRVVEIIEWT